MDHKYLTKSLPPKQPFSRGPLYAVLVIFAVELLCFYPSIRETGFYLDDWLFISTFEAGPSDFWKALVNLLKVDSRFLNRPVEAVLFLASYKTFGLNPFGYHVFNSILESISAWLFYMCLLVLTRRQLVSLSAALIFLLYPNHNCTHYWVSCIVVSLSLCLYLGSLLSNLKGANSDKNSWHVLSFLLFTLSLFNYEVFLPLASLNVLLVLFLKSRTNNARTAFKESAKVALLLASAVGILLLYLKGIMPLLGEAWMHTVSFNFNLMTETVLKGLSINSPNIALNFFNSKISSEFPTGLSQIQLAKLFLIVAVVLGSACTIRESQPSETETDQKITAGSIFLVGLVSLVASYSIFGLNPEYMPTYDTLVNRVNTGASIGLSMIFGSILILGSHYISLLNKSAKASKMLVVTMTLPIILFFVVSNWALAKPYELSWQLQAHIAKFLKLNRENFKGCKSLILADSPRYVYEAPVFDGTWDFRSMARIMLKNPDIDGSVASERLKLEDNEIKDLVYGFLCTKFDYNGLLVLFSPSCRLEKVNNPEEFVRLFENAELQFLPKSAVEKWKSDLELVQTSRSKSSIGKNESIKLKQ